MFGKKKTVEREVVEMTTKDKAQKYKHELLNGYAVDTDCNVKKDKFGNAKKLTQKEVLYRQGFLGAMGETYTMSANLKRKPNNYKNSYNANYKKNKATKKDW